MPCSVAKKKKEKKDTVGKTEHICMNLGLPFWKMRWRLQNEHVAGLGSQGCGRNWKWRARGESAGMGFGEGWVSFKDVKIRGSSKALGFHEVTSHGLEICGRTIQDGASEKRWLHT